eukprot:48565_1
MSVDMDDEHFASQPPTAASISSPNENAAKNETKTEAFHANRQVISSNVDNVISFDLYQQLIFDIWDICIQIRKHHVTKHAKVSRNSESRCNCTPLMQKRFEEFLIKKENRDSWSYFKRTQHFCHQLTCRRNCSWEKAKEICVMINDIISRLESNVNNSTRSGHKSWMSHYDRTIKMMKQIALIKSDNLSEIESEEECKPLSELVSLYDHKPNIVQLMYELKVIIMVNAFIYRCFDIVGDKQFIEIFLKLFKTNKRTRLKLNPYDVLKNLELPRWYGNV